MSARFSKMADSYAEYATLQRRIGKIMRDIMPNVPVLRIVDVGCGSGDFTMDIAKKYTDATVIGIDNSARMVAAATKRHPTGCFVLGSSVGDFNPDWIVSNSALQWMTPVPTTIMMWGKSLQPGSWIWCSVFGPETYRELRRISAEFVVASTFDSLASIYAEFEKLGDVTGRVFEFQLRFSTVRAFLRSIHMTGTGTPVLNGLRTPRWETRLMDQFRVEFGGVVVTAEVGIFGCQIR